MRIAALIFQAIVGLAVGYTGAFVVMTYLVGQHPEPIDLIASFKAETAWIATPGDGWGRTTRAGTALVASTANLALPLPHPTKGDLVLDLRAGAAKRSNGPPVEIEVRVNGQSLGAWRLAQMRVKRLLLPAATANRRNPLDVTFVTKAPAGAITIEALALKEFAALTEFAGHLDVCANGTIIGWAEAGTEPSPVIVRRNGTPTLTVLPTVERPDLPPAGHTLDAGFNLTLTPPLQPGERIEVVFPNGRRIRGDACGG